RPDGRCVAGIRHCPISDRTRWYPTGTVRRDRKPPCKRREASWVARLVSPCSWGHSARSSTRSALPGGAAADGQPQTSAGTSFRGRRAVMVVLVLAPLIVGVISGYALGGRLRALAGARLHATWLLWLGAGLQFFYFHWQGPRLALESRLG